MAGSPEYINLLADIGTEPKPETPDWDGLEAVWEIGIRYAPYHPQVLKALSWVAFHIIAAETGKRIEAVLAEAVELHVRKNKGYAGNSTDFWANFRLATQLGVTPVQGVLIRMTDKWSRIKSLRDNPENDEVDESIEDTLMDLAAYSLIAICLINEEKAAEVSA